MDSDKKYWFPAKPPGYGWGWGLPITWQGWAVYLAFFVLLIAGCVALPLWFQSRGTLSGFSAGAGIALWGVCLGAALIGVGFWKGEPPGPFFGRK